MRPAGRTAKWLWSRIPGSKPGSKWRNLFTYVASALTLGLVVEAVFAQAGRPILTDMIAGFALIVFVAVYFLVVVIGVIFLTSRKFRPDPLRLARDTLVSVALTIMAFSVFYRSAGITLDSTCDRFPIAPSDAIYFSAVTFSTLGYGDFRPCPTATARLMSAFHAIFGNLHLGLIVGAAYFFAQRIDGSGEDGSGKD